MFSQAARPLLWAGIIGPLTFFAVFTVDGAITPGYSALRDAVSYLALGPHGWVQTLNFIFLAVCVGAFALGLFKSWRPVSRSVLIAIGCCGIASSGVGYLLAAILPAHRPPQPPGPLHTMAFEIVFFGQGFACLLIGLRLVSISRWRWIGWMSLLVALVTVAAAAGNLSSLISQAPQTPISSPSGAFPLGGLFNRILIAIAFTWYLIVASRLLLASRRSVD